MTHLLRKAFDEAAKLAEREQDELARWLLEELKSEREWEQHFGDSQDVLAKLGQEALDEYQRGETTPLDPESL